MTTEQRHRGCNSRFLFLSLSDSSPTTTLQEEIPAATVAPSRFDSKGEGIVWASWRHEEVGRNHLLAILKKFKLWLKSNRINHIDDLFSVAGAGQVTFNKTAPNNVSYLEHKQSFVDKLVEAQNKIFYKTRRAQANWCVAGMDASNIIETLPGFVPSGLQNTMGIVQTGVLNGRWTIYKDPYIATDTFMVGHKGISFLETGRHCRSSWKQDDEQATQMLGTLCWN